METTYITGQQIDTTVTWEVENMKERVQGFIEGFIETRDDGHSFVPYHDLPSWDSDTASMKEVVGHVMDTLDLAVEAKVENQEYPEDAEFLAGLADEYFSDEKFRAACTAAAIEYCAGFRTR